MDPKKQIRKPFGKTAVEFYVTFDGDIITDEVNTSIELIARNNNITFEEDEDHEAKLRKELGEREFEDSLQNFVMNRLAPFIINTEENLSIATDPLCSSEQIPKREEDFEFTIRVLQKPPVSLTSYDPVTVKMPIREITQEEIDKQLDQFISLNTTFEANEDQTGSAQIGDNISLDMYTTDKNGEKLNGLSGKNKLLLLDYAYMPREFVDQIIGMKVGQTKKFTFSVEEEFNYDGDDDPGTYETEVTINEFQHQVVPTLTDEFVKQSHSGFDSYQDLLDSVTKYIQSQHDEADEQYKEMLVDAAISERYTDKVSDEIYETVSKRIVDNMRTKLKQEGKTIEQYIEENELTDQQLEMEIMMESRNVIRQSFALDALYEELFDEELTEEDIDAAYKKIAPSNPDAVREDFEKSGRNYAIEEIAKRLKAHNWLMETAEVEYVEQPTQPRQPTIVDMNGFSEE